MTIYHGSNVKVEKPEVLVRGFYKDFGYGFYCTNVKFKYPIHQIVFCTDRSLQTIKFERSYSL